MKLSHIRPIAAAKFDDPNLVSCAGLVPTVALAQQCELATLADEHLTVPTDKGANPGAKVASLVAGMVAGADSIDDMACCGTAAMANDRSITPTRRRRWDRSCVRSRSGTSASSTPSRPGSWRAWPTARLSAPVAGDRRAACVASMSTTPSSRSMVTPSRVPGSATTRSAA